MILLNQMKKSLRDNLGVIFIIVLALVPLVLWYPLSPLGVRFSSSGAIFRSLGQLTGLLGMALLSINFILAARFRFLDKLFSGLNRVYVKHHIIGALSFCFLLFHPLFLTAQYLSISLKAALIFLFSFQDWPMNFGKLGLLLLIVLMVITFYLNFKYQNWKNTHKYLGIVLFLGGLHMFFIPSDVSNNALLKYYMFSLASLGAFSYLYRTIFGIYKKGEYKYKLEKIIKINENVAELKLSPLSSKIRFLPGQFVFLRFESSLGEGENYGILSEAHPFSVTSYPDDKDLSLGIKALGDYTSMVYLMKPGTICKIEGPFGAFSYKKAQSKKQIWIAGGIGITPFLSMARHINVSGDNDYKIDLYYSIKNVSEAAFGSELREISRQNENFKFYEHFSERDGYISTKFISNNNSDISGADVFLCGPPSFMQSLREQFIKLGFGNNKIHSEEFSLST
ncbi:MAG: hypothetical protein A2644_04050 [Candidatus Zambryskibacteria bacterium RIFCSPHIGHO2_01_FULL_39_63]|nr:MAG: hypothetical protein A2644_04050 [Candidatus Zambryskibacteria bacterium RIFCSPHIGHO2_01_FULL_39_63]OHA95332.1 MAG: hypothetical protein A3B88_02535 [Candidatus Zambryskibacteria bacterium RIFCSPHIGHO2_02_FULL_39_19]OHA97990.1 MAG: hypothetical protein A3F20_04425 [Candidatus Zambryskibacteria bacterium RIFCSPHIGHO2_12_FULL_39_21]